MTAELDFDLASTADEVRRCAQFYLLWVASADGAPTPEQRELIARSLAEDERSEALSELGDIVEDRELESLLFAARTLRDRMGDDDQLAFLGLAFRVGGASGRFPPGANHICRFLADLFEISPMVADQLHRDLFERALHKPADPSSPDWWFTESPFAADYQAERREALLADSRPLSAEEARVVLGIARAAEVEEIRKAYRRMAQIYHPDRADAHGDRDQAHARFLRVREAYEVLSP